MGLISRFFKFYWLAETKYTIHSPFIFSLIEDVVEDSRVYYSFGALERLRILLSNNQKEILVTDMGAGSRVNNQPLRSISSISKSAVSPQWQCEFLFRLVHFFQPKNRLELGTSLGLSTMYQYFPVQEATFHTLEGCPNIARVAEENFKRLKASNIQLHVGSFELNLPKVLEEIGALDYVYIDGNHQKAPTLSYFNQCLSYSHANTVFVFDDIHWSDEMEEAWESIKAHPKVRLSLDFFYMGLVFLREEQLEKQHFNIVPSVYKPWKMGFFHTSKR